MNELEKDVEDLYTESLKLLREIIVKVMERYTVFMGWKTQCF